jgi:dTDP-4-dehydrorhamnose 3,5-epimerase-like enzyme
MQSFKFEKLQFDGLYLISPFLAEDNRGYFLKNYEKEVFEKAGIDTDVFEAFESLSVKGVVRGLHFQTDNPQSKIVRCITGRIYDVVVDIRKDSPTFGKCTSSDGALLLFSVLINPNVVNDELTRKFSAVICYIACPRIAGYAIGSADLSREDKVLRYL